MLLDYDESNDESTDDICRTRYLLLLAAMPHFAKLISPPITTVLMARNIYLPSVVSSVIVVFCAVLLRIVRNIGHAYKTPSSETCQSSEPLLNDSHQSYATTSSGNQSSSESSVDIRDEVPTEATSSVHRADLLSINALLPRTLHHCKNIAAWLHREPLLTFGALAFFLKSNAMASEAFVFQYLSEKFGWPLRETTILRFALSLGAVITTLVIGPIVISVLARRGVPTATIDLGIILISLFVLTACFIVAWRADSSTVFILCTCVHDHRYHTGCTGC
jgi:hypothetical protein